MPTAEEVVTVLAVCAREEDQISLEHVFSHSKWKMYRARTCREANEFVLNNPTPVIVCEDELPDGSWKDLLVQACARPNPPRLIVSSHAADERLWAEVLDGGGYDVLGKPFDSGEVIRVISLAWRQWKFEREKTQVSGR